MSIRTRRSYSPEFKDEAVRRVLDGAQKVPAVARELGVNEQTLRNWVNVYQERNPAVERPLAVSERARLRELEREVVELREKSRFLGKAAAFFAQEHRAESATRERRGWLTGLIRKIFHDHHETYGSGVFTLRWSAWGTGAHRSWSGN